MKEVELSRVTVVSWDIDGTLYDLHRLMSAFKLDLFRRMLSLKWVAAWRDFFRLLQFKRFMDRVRKNQGDYAVGSVPNRSAIAATQDEMYGRILPTIGELEGVRDLLEWFEGRGVRQVAFSDYRPSTKLSVLKLEVYFVAVYAGEDLGHLKPAREAFEAMLADLKVTPEELLHIGDRVDTDGAAAPIVGFQAAIIGHEFASAHALLRHLQDQ
jgi:HAD superfamily hydrolase (TIGR01549 family)